MDSYFREELSISVIVPIFNAELYLNKCIDSILKQTYQNIEIILVDDGSTDDSLYICREYQEKDYRIKYFRQENSGQAAARNAGIGKATGDYITFVDADDYLDTDAYEHIVSAMANNRVDVVAYGLTEVYSDKSIKKKNHYPEGVYVHKELRGMYHGMLSYGSFFDFGVLPNLVCKFIKSSFLKKTVIKVSDDVTIGEDADVTYQLMVNADSVQIIDYAPYQYCKRNDSMMWKPIPFSSIVSLEMDLRNAFELANVSAIMNVQLKDYITFITLLKHPSKILYKEFPFCDKDIKIALYGAGGMGQVIYLWKKINITLWVDCDFEKYRKYGQEVDSIDELFDRQEEYDSVFIAILNYELCESIKQDLIDRGMKKDIYYYKKE